jgi:hypothetical protein
MKDKSIFASRRATVPHGTTSNSNRQKGMHFTSEERGEPKLHILSPLMHLLNSARPHPAAGPRRLEEPAARLGTGRMVTGRRRTWRRGGVNGVWVKGEGGRGADVGAGGAAGQGRSSSTTGWRSQRREASAPRDPRRRARPPPPSHPASHRRGSRRSRAWASARGACAVASARAPPPPPSPSASHRRGRAWVSSSAPAPAAGGEGGTGRGECVCFYAVRDRLFCFANGATVREAKLRNASPFLPSLVGPSLSKFTKCFTLPLVPY